MADEKTVSFSRLVWSKAYENTGKVFASDKRDAFVGVPTLLVGFFLYSIYRGFPMALDELVTAFFFGFAPLSLIVCVVFLWHLWIAPSELVRDATRANTGIIAPPQSPTAKPVNWAIWTHRAEITLLQASAALAKMDPNTSMGSNERSGFLQLMLEDASNKKLTYIPSYHSSAYGGQRQERDVDQNTQITLSLIKWARKKGFDVDHLKPQPK